MKVKSNGLIYEKNIISFIFKIESFEFDIFNYTFQIN